MQVNTLKLNTKRKKRKTVGRGGKKGTYSGKGMKGQKARSGVSINPLFEGGRSTLIDHMKKKRGFKSLKPKKNIVKLSDLAGKFPDGGEVSLETLIKSGLVDKITAKNGVKILGDGQLTKKLTISSNILFSESAKTAILEAGGKIIKEQKTVSSEQKTVK